MQDDYVKNLPEAFQRWLNGRRIEEVECIIAAVCHILKTRTRNMPNVFSIVYFMSQGLLRWFLGRLKTWQFEHLIKSKVTKRQLLYIQLCYTHTPKCRFYILQSLTKCIQKSHLH